MPKPGQSDLPKGASPRTLHGLDWLNFPLADVRTGVGPFLAISFGSLAIMLVIALARREGMEVHTGRLVLLGLWVGPVLVVATALAMALIFSLAW